MSAWNEVIQRIFADRYRGTAVRQTDGTDIPVPFVPEVQVPNARKEWDLDPSFRWHDEPGHPLGSSTLPPERYVMVEDNYGDVFIIPESSRDAWLEETYIVTAFRGESFKGAVHVEALEDWTFERPEGPT